MREAMLALLSKEPSHGYELHRRLCVALGEAVTPLNVGQVYVTLSRLEKSGFVMGTEVEQTRRSDKKVYAVTAAGRELVAHWLADVSWRKSAPADFHLKLVAAAATAAADPVGLIDTQRRELLRHLAEIQHALAGTSEEGEATLLLEGAALRIQADIRWLEVCELHWTQRRRT